VPVTCYPCPGNWLILISPIHANDGMALHQHQAICIRIASGLQQQLQAGALCHGLSTLSTSAFQDLLQECGEYDRRTWRGKVRPHWLSVLAVIDLTTALLLSI
jgi:hypothetical protein